MTLSLCQYKNLFGKPREGVRKYRIFDIAVFDTLFVVLIGWFLAWITKIHIIIVLLGLFILGIIVHRVFCVRTGIDKLLFPDERFNSNK